MSNIVSLLRDFTDGTVELDVKTGIGVVHSHAMQNLSSHGNITQNTVKQHSENEELEAEYQLVRRIKTIDVSSC